MRAILIAAVLGCVAFTASPAQACDPHEWPCFRKEWSEPKAIRSAKPARVARASYRAPQPRPAREQGGFFSGGGGGSHRLVAIAGQYLGRNPTGQSHLWCQDLINLVLRKAGHRDTGSRMARSSLGIGRSVSSGSVQAGDIGVMSRGRSRTAGHVGIVAAVSGNRVLLRGGNQCGSRGRRTVCDSWVDKSRFIGFRRV